MHIFYFQGSNTNSLTKKNSDSIGDLSKSEESGNELADCEEVHLRAKPVRIGERSSVNQCINEISSCLTEAAARRRCNSEVVSRTATDKETNGKLFMKKIIKGIIEVFFTLSHIWALIRGSNYKTYRLIIYEQVFN